MPIPRFSADADTDTPVSVVHYQRLSSTEIISNGRTLDGPELKLAMYGHCMVNYNSMIYVIGGVTKSGDETAQTWIHSYEMKFISDGPRMTSARYYHGCATLNIKNKETIIVVGGFGGSDSAEFLDPITNSWKESKSFRCN